MGITAPVTLNVVSGQLNTLILDINIDKIAQITASDHPSTSSAEDINQIITATTDAAATQMKISVEGKIAAIHSASSFTLSPDGGAHSDAEILVFTDTQVVDANNNISHTTDVLTVGMIVDVKGLLDAQTQAINASKVRIEAPSSSNAETATMPLANA
ncbi:MAG: DUF5666 domain-containing protein, partial [Gammaproteobacteria bacterium]|nr:DUF5666 domain-containing protein [Gammaproteobacteria bacterium]